MCRSLALVFAAYELFDCRPDEGYRKDICVDLGANSLPGLLAQFSSIPAIFSSVSVNTSVGTPATVCSTPDYFSGGTFPSTPVCQAYGGGVWNYATCNATGLLSYTCNDSECTSCTFAGFDPGA